MKKSIKLFIVLFLVGIISLFSCRKDNKVSVAPATCDTANITFAAVQPIFAAACTNCHSQLDNEADAKDWGNFPRLMGTLTHEAGFMAMPVGSAKLSDCEISKIQAWYNKVK